MKTCTMETAACLVSQSDGLSVSCLATSCNKSADYRLYAKYLIPNMVFLVFNIKIVLNWVSQTSRMNVKQI